MNLFTAVKRIENPFLLFTGSVDWIAMRDSMSEAEWRNYVSLNRQLRAMFKS